MELHELRAVLVERYVASGYKRDRAETVVDTAIRVHENCVAHRVEVSREACKQLATGIERSDCLSTLLSLEAQHAQAMLFNLHGGMPVTIQ